ncbi:hypothetical protein BN381_80013 [Candidatus Microthrix parvicella RN1]|uniref:Uncharacterized protein n=1 Tax=Candidatus Neomicrothrix parvicella RN1 TaxID=1229780 RepID=R4Z426_9ACTN|nr:hypothetical protein BN381_80013 [Candidatus Microthrix parvicella RN1]
MVTQMGFPHAVQPLVSEVNIVEQHRQDFQSELACPREFIEYPTPFLFLMIQIPFDILACKYNQTICTLDLLFDGLREWSHTIIAIAIPDIEVGRQKSLGGQSDPVDIIVGEAQHSLHR